MLPRLEKNTLRLRLLTAREFADEGRLADGYDCLLIGLDHAHEAARLSEPWAAELVLSYLEALDGYIQRYGVRIE